MWETPSLSMCSHMHMQKCGGFAEMHVAGITASTWKLAYFGKSPQGIGTFTINMLLISKDEKTNPISMLLQWHLAKRQTFLHDDRASATVSDSAECNW